MIRIIRMSVPPGERVLRACAMLGLGVRYLNRTPKRTPRPKLPPRFRALIQSLPPGVGVFITGPSGAGKTTLLAQTAAHLRSRGDAHVEEVPSTPLPNRPVIDLLEGTIEAALAILSCAGLAEGALLVRTPTELSEGQRWRLRLALAMQRCERFASPPLLDPSIPHPLIPSSQSKPELSNDPTRANRGVPPRTYLLIDELCASLDTTTAKCVCRMLARWSKRCGVCIIAAGPRPRAAAWLGAKHIVRVMQ